MQQLDLSRVGIVGSGRVGAVLGAALTAVGATVVAASARTSTARAAALLPGVPLLDPSEVAARASLVLLAVPDDALADVARLVPADRTVVHVSGRHGLAPLAHVRRPLALHPVLPFSGTAADLDRLPGLSWGVTAPEHLLPLADSLVQVLGGRTVHVEDARRPLWHAALAHGANHLTALVAQAADLLRDAGAADPGAVLRPLLEAALEGALTRGDDALTGPVVRGDAGTVGTHLDVLPADARSAYLALARLTADRALTSGRLPADRADALLTVLRRVPA